MGLALLKLVMSLFGVTNLRHQVMAWRKGGGGGRDSESRLKSKERKKKEKTHKKESRREKEIEKSWNQILLKC